MYRRPMSPYNSRVATYLQALERDETINSLRRQYAYHRSVESEYDDLKYEISKAERQNKKLEQKNRQIQDQYMEKVKCNKDLISELGSQIEQVQTKIKATASTSSEKQEQNEKLIQTIKDTKNKISDCQQSNRGLERDVEQQEGVIIKFNETIEQMLIKKKDAQKENKSQSESIDIQFQQYKQTQEKTKDEETLNLQLRQELNILKSKKSKLLNKVEQIQQKMKELKKKFQHAEYQREKMSLRCQEAEKEAGKFYCEALSLKENIQSTLSKNKDQTAKLKSLEVVLKQNTANVYNKQSTKEKLITEHSQMTKDIEKAEAVIRTLNKQTEDQEASNKGLIQNLKKSIQSDQEAVKALTRKAAILNLISQS